uniref:Uncharacterized protein n=1 Tax=Rousettus aegyptiacus TaxID=9407 RepID=A0A7J8KAT1_ROUAE|nr:hypothetical protein HJG63_007781 [Rousettus aegyptiacus]
MHHFFSALQNPRISDAEAEAQRGEVTCPRSHSWSVALKSSVGKPKVRIAPTRHPKLRDAFMAHPWPGSSSADSGSSGSSHSVPLGWVGLWWDLRTMGSGLPLNTTGPWGSCITSWGPGHPIWVQGLIIPSLCSHCGP